MSDEEQKGGPPPRELHLAMLAADDAGHRCTRAFTGTQASNPRVVIAVRLVCDRCGGTFDWKPDGSTPLPRCEPYRTVH